jgi:REP element-mobilizing transposase RayT
MPRRPRVHAAGAFYHVTLRGNHRQAIFRHHGDRAVLNSLVAEQLEEAGASLHAYCWMTNHLHLLVQVSNVPLGRPMQGIGARYARWYQSALPTTGHLFERRYHALLVDKDSYLLELVRYIHLNPVRAALVKDPIEHPWSSHAVYLGERDEPWVRTGFVLGMLAPDPARARSAYGQLVQQGMLSLDDDASSSGGGAAELLNRLRLAEPDSRAAESLEELILRHCESFHIQPEDLTSSRRDRRLAHIRATIAHDAISRRVSSLAAVARRLNRDESSLRECLDRHVRAK